MTTQHFVDAQGAYLGGFGDGALPPVGGVEVPEPPHGLAMWINGAWVAPVIVPPVISKLQAELAVGEAVVAQVEAIMGDPATPWAMRRGWASASQLYRTSQTVDELAYLLGWDGAQVDAMFIAAAEIMA